MLRRVGKPKYQPRTDRTTEPGQTLPIWYRIHPWIALGVAAALFAVISLIRMYTASSSDAVAILYTIPVALLALTFGLRGGLSGATLGYGLFVVFALIPKNGSVDAFGWTTRGVGLFLLGGLLGHAVDHGQVAHQWALAEQRRRLQLEEHARRQRAALEIGDSLIQGMTAAKWLAEQDDPERVIDVLTTTIEEGGRLVSDLLSDDLVEASTRTFSFERADDELTPDIPEV